MVNPTYRHLEDALRVGRFSLAQWAQLLAGLLVALGFGVYLSPLPPGPTVSVSVLVGGLPLACSYAAMGLEFSVLQFALSLGGWGCRPRRYLPGPGAASAGYLVHAEATQPAPRSTTTASGELAALWDA
jgi:hypothetical protein